MIENILFNPYVQAIYWVSVAIKIAHRIYFWWVFEDIVQEEIEEGEDPKKAVFTLWIITLCVIFIPIANTYSAYMSLHQFYRSFTDNTDDQ